MIKIILMNSSERILLYVFIVKKETIIHLSSERTAHTTAFNIVRSWEVSFQTLNVFIKRA